MSSVHLMVTKINWYKIYKPLVFVLEISHEQKSQINTHVDKADTEGGGSIKTQAGEGTTYSSFCIVNDRTMKALKRKQCKNVRVASCNKQLWYKSNK